MKCGWPRHFLSCRLSTLHPPRLPKLGFSPPFKLPSNHRTGRGNAFTHLRITSTTTRAPTLERLWELKGLGYPQRTLNWYASRDHLLSHILVQLPVSCASSPTSPLCGYKYFPNHAESRMFFSGTMENCGQIQDMQSVFRIPDRNPPRVTPNLRLA